MAMIYPKMKLSEAEAVAAVADFLGKRFRYTPDPVRTTQEGYRVADHWRHRGEIETSMLQNGGELQDDCDGAAFAAVYALADLGIPARVVTGWDENGQYHAVAESASGWVLDNRHLGRVLTWRDQPKFTKDQASGFFEFGETGQWRAAR